MAKCSLAHVLLLLAALYATGMARLVREDIASQIYGVLTFDSIILRTAYIHIPDSWAQGTSLPASHPATTYRSKRNKLRRFT